MPEPKYSHFDRDLQKTNPTNLAKLLSLDAALPWSDDDLAAILRHQLETRLDVTLTADIPGVASTEMHQSISEFLTSQRPSLPLLRACKDFAKSNRSDPGAVLPSEVATVLYYAAILAARLRWRARISELSPADLLGGAEWALSRPWMSASLVPLFQEAKAALENETSGAI